MSHYKLIMSLIDGLFKPEQRRLEGRIKAINAQNKELTNVNVDGFLFEGIFYRPATGTLNLAPKGESKKIPHPSLWEEIRGYVSDLNDIHRDASLIKQVLQCLLSDCHSDQDIRDALPECLVGFCSGLDRLKRTREPAYTIQANQTALAQYLKILPKMEVYSVSQLLY